MANERTGEYIDATSPDGAIHFLVLPAERNKTAESMGEAGNAG